MVRNYLPVELVAYILAFLCGVSSLSFHPTDDAVRLLKYQLVCLKLYKYKIIYDYYYS